MYKTGFPITLTVSSSRLLACPPVVIVGHKEEAYVMIGDPLLDLA